MIASGKILSPNVTLSQGIRAKGGNQRVQVKASGIQSAVGSKKTTFASSSFASGELSQSLKVSSSQKFQMTRRAMFTVTNGVSSERPGENLLDYSIHNKTQAPKPVRKPEPLDQASALSRGAHYWVENSKMSNKMICEETKTG
jgi:hypothetical protein